MAIHRLAVIGNPVAHSRSPEIHAAFAHEAGIEIDYAKLLAPTDGFREVALDFVAGGGIGFNVTVPFKFEAYRLCDQLSEAARLSEAVNTVALVEGRLCGANTDGTGICRDIEQNLLWQLSDKRILVLGAGGAVSGVLPALLRVGPACLHIHNRTAARAEALAERFGAPIEARTAETLEAAYDIIISGTSAGLTGAGLALPGRIVGSASRCYDMIYSEKETVFNSWAKANGARAVSDGLGMLVEQAAEAFNIWFGFMPQSKPVIEHMRAAMRRVEE